MVGGVSVVAIRQKGLPTSGSGVPGERRAHVDHDVVDGQRLGPHTDRAELSCFPRDGIGDEGAHEDERHLRSLPLQGADHVHTGDVGKAEVDQQQIEAAGSAQGEAAGAGSGSGDLEAVRAEHPVQRLANAEVVVDDEDGAVVALVEGRLR